MRSLRVAPMSRHLAGLLSLLLAVQGLLPLAAHTTLAVDGRGEMVQICTLHGLQTRFLDHEGRLAPDVPPGDDINPAVQFSQLVAEALGAFQPPLAPSPDYESSGVPTFRRAILPGAVAGLRAIRAPPPA